MIHVVAAVIRSDDRILLAKRPDHLHQGGLWEFPGGKLEGSETRQQALKRELQEELGIEVEKAQPLIQVTHHYPDKAVLLDVWDVSRWTGDPEGREGQQTRWVSAHQLVDYQFPAANYPILKACQLSDQYLITPSFDHDESGFLSALEYTVQSGVQLVQYRQKSLHGEEFRQLARNVISRCRQYSARVLINDSPAVAMEIGADGVHLTSKLLMGIDERPLPGSMLVGASCHNEDELRQAEIIGADFAVLGPVQQTRSHPGSNYLGWSRFSQLVKNCKLPVFALGGMRPSCQDQARSCGAQGIAGITGLWGVGNT